MTRAAAPPLIVWYGDDFTGSTDALEVLALGGLRAVLYLDKVTDERLLRRFAGAQAVGLAGISRSRSPQWMSDHLPELFAWLRAFGGRVCHYKVCSTFDSSPGIGNIGRAIEIGRAVFGTRVVPIVAGAPALQRYTAFGHLFAAFGSQVYRLDRHPAMSRHPVTPMLEADLRKHLALQTGLNIGLVSLPEMLKGRAAARLREIEQSGGCAALLDVCDEASLLEAGRAIWPAADEPPRFVAGSSGVEHGLMNYWRSLGIPPGAAASPPPAEAGRLVVLSGSCSPATSRQIRHAINAGYHAIHVAPAALLTAESGFADLVDTAVTALRQGRNVVLYTALDQPGESPIDLDERDRISFGERLGTRCGTLLRSILLRSGVKRAVIAGGDTSGHAGRQLSLDALTFMAPLAAGAPLCLAHSPDPGMDGLELVFKGGQIGDDGFFEFARAGRR